MVSPNLVRLVALEVKGMRERENCGPLGVWKRDKVGMVARNSRSSWKKVRKCQERCSLRINGVHIACQHIDFELWVDKFLLPKQSGLPSARTNTPWHLLKWCCQALVLQREQKLDISKSYFTLTACWGIHGSSWGVGGQTTERAQEAAGCLGISLDIQAMKKGTLHFQSGSHYRQWCWEVKQKTLCRPETMGNGLEFSKGNRTDRMNVSKEIVSFCYVDWAVLQWLSAHWRVQEPCCCSVHYAGGLRSSSLGLWSSWRFLIPSLVWRWEKLGCECSKRCWEQW